MSLRVLVLGSTGSVGTQSLDVLTRLRNSHRVVGLAASTSAAALSAQAATWQPEAVCLSDPSRVSELDLPAGCRSFSGPQGLVDLVDATAPDIVICAITGAAGLPSTLAAADRGCRLALANKESMVMAGPLVKRACARSGASIVPVDSEHSAIAQCLAGQDRAGVRRLILTASGGPFRGRTLEQMQNVTVAQALRHPSWEMGPRITIDSATLMNKALEVVEACQLFDMPPDQVDVIVHPQSVIHSMVEYVDGAVLAQLSPPDMRLPIRYALGGTCRVSSGAPPVDLQALTGLSFEAPDRRNFPCLVLGERVARSGGLSGTILNAANEVAVAAFLDGRLPFTSIHDVVEDALDVLFDPSVRDPDLATILETDGRVRRHAEERVPQLAS